MWDSIVLQEPQLALVARVERMHLYKAVVLAIYVQEIITVLIPFLNLCLVMRENSVNLDLSCVKRQRLELRTMQRLDLQNLASLVHITIQQQRLVKIVNKVSTALDQQHYLQDVLLGLIKTKLDKANA